MEFIMGAGQNNINIGLFEGIFKFPGSEIKGYFIMSYIDGDDSAMLRGYSDTIDYCLCDMLDKYTDLSHVEITFAQTVLNHIKFAIENNGTVKIANPDHVKELELKVEFAEKYWDMLQEDSA